MYDPERLVDAERLVRAGLSVTEARKIASTVNRLLADATRLDSWQEISTRLLKPDQPFPVHEYLHGVVFADHDPQQGPAPAWIPPAGFCETTNLGRLMTHLGMDSYAQLHGWSVENPAEYWRLMIERLDIRFKERCQSVLGRGSDPESPRWLAGAKMNIVDSCFGADAGSSAIVYQAEGGPMASLSYGELLSLSSRVAVGLKELGLVPGDAVAVNMPMTAEAVAACLGIVMAGYVVLSIADSFAPPEIEARLRIGKARAIFTQDRIQRGGRQIPLYSRVTEANAPKAVVIPLEGMLRGSLRPGDLSWDDFLGSEEGLDSVSCCPDDPTNVLFSSGTTGQPKAIPFTHLTPIKCAADGALHQNICNGDVLAWPSNLGWMMGPWLIYAALLNRATMALYYGSPTGRGFGQFVEQAGVNMLGVVPSLVRAWRTEDCMRGLDWSAIRAFSSTGECSHPGDMHFLMSLASYRPVIEYCGGTEVGGAYLTGTVIQPCAAAAFSTPAMGLDLAILDQDGREADNGEVFLIPPSIGLSTTLLNQDHHEVYFEGAPAGPGGRVLRRHGDQVERLGGGYYRVHGRVDDTMNLSGIKVGSAEIERVLNLEECVEETAAVAVPSPTGGSARLVIYVVLQSPLDRAPRRDELKHLLQEAIRQRLNPLFKVHDVTPVRTLPRTASNKIMRRKLRAEYSNL